MSDQPTYGPDVQAYIDRAKILLAERAAVLARARTMKFDTLAVHGLYTVEEALRLNQGAIIEPVYFSTSQAYRDAAELEAALAYLIPTWCYTRIANPTTTYLEETLALLEGYGTGLDTSCCVTASGLAAIVLATDPFVIRPEGGSQRVNFVSSIQVYGGTFQHFSVRLMGERGVECRWVLQPSDIGEWAARVDEDTRFLFMEAPSNPQQSFADLKALAGLAHRWEIPLIVDATCATPALMRPLAHGADIVVQSLTKSATMGGSAVAGALVSRKPIVTKLGRDNPLFREDFAQYVKLYPYRDSGAAPSPLNAFLVSNDLRTLRSKMDLVSLNCQKVAEFLRTHPRVYQVDYLGLPDHPLHGIAGTHMKLVDSDDGTGNEVNRYGHLMGFRVDGPPENARKVFDRFRMIYRATDLGRIKSVATIPAISTHQQQGEEARRLADIPPQLIRLCVGAEHPDDVMADLDQALAAL
ncbi:MAG: O-acetylhomoserine aminocarboxypropyltransferase/cysteine synthase [Candidatus Aminicenantes bacterium]|nr:O-acetylhomoserine aminocarboxypropyltransferase/cysteine synthase [Candidatus Aminicenantes bacterium]